MYNKLHLRSLLPAGWTELHDGVFGRTLAGFSQQMF